MRCQLRKRENLTMTIVACWRKQFLVFCMSFLVFLFSALKQRVWSWQQTIFLLVLTHKYSSHSHIKTPSRRTQQVNFQSVAPPVRQKKWCQAVHWLLQTPTLIVHEVFLGSSTDGMRNHNTIVASAFQKTEIYHQNVRYCSKRNLLLVSTDGSGIPGENRGILMKLAENWCNLNLKIISPGSRTRDFTVVGRYNYHYAVKTFTKLDEVWSNWLVLKY